MIAGITRRRKLPRCRFVKAHQTLGGWRVHRALAVERNKNKWCLCQIEIVAEITLWYFPLSILVAVNKKMCASPQYAIRAMKCRENDDGNISKHFGRG